MKVSRPVFFLRTAILSLFVLVFLEFTAPAQTNPSSQPADTQPRHSATVPALLISDIHFEPFWDPGKVAGLAAAPVSQWESILSSPPSPDRDSRFAALEQNCHMRGEDASWPLLQSARQAIRAHAAGVRFVTVGGDLLSHSFSCKYNALLPNSTPAAYREFVQKTIRFVIDSVDGIFPGTPAYVALGNNDSDCGDYQFDAHSDFLAATGRLIARNFSFAARASVRQSFAAEGNYSVALPAPMAKARLIVLNDVFLSTRYSSCSGKPDPQAAADQIAWLRQQLAQARAAGEKVWVMGHIPTGIDVYASRAALADPCGSRNTVSFLSSDSLGDALTESSDVIALVLFGHTHMDEIQLLEPEAPAQSSPATATAPAARQTAGPVAVKLVPSISPIHGNHPSFTVAQVDPATAALVDYKVIASGASAGAGAWSEEYDYANRYHQAAFTAAAVSRLISGFAADAAAGGDASRNYIRNYLVGGQLSIPPFLWPAFVCTLNHRSAGSFKACACAAR